MTYSPNVTDNQFITRAKKVYGFTRACLKTNSEQQWVKTHLDKVFGQQQNDMSAWFRELILLPVNEHYDMEAGKCKSYISSSRGTQYLRALLRGETTSSREEYFAQWSGIASSRSEEILSYTSIEHSLAALRQTTQLKDQEREQDNSYSSPQLSVLLGSRDREFDDFDLQLVLEWCKREHAEEIATGLFKYKDKSNRLWHMLQNITRELKPHVFKELGFNYSYDIESCAPRLILQFAQHLGMDEYLFAINELLKDKHAVREYVKDMGSMDDIKKAKILINSLFSGAKLGANEQFALFHLLDCDYDAVKALQTDQYIIELRADIKKCWAAIEPAVGTTFITDKNGKSRKQPMTSKRKWGCYFRLERQILDSVKRYLDETNNPCFLEHDGWATRDEIDMDDLLEHIFIETGFNLKLDMSEYDKLDKLPGTHFELNEPQSKYDEAYFKEPLCTMLTTKLDVPTYQINQNYF